MTWHIRGQLVGYETEGEALAEAWRMTAPGQMRPEVYELNVPPPPGSDVEWVKFSEPTVERGEDHRTVVTLNAWGEIDQMPAHISTAGFNTEEWRHAILNRMKAFVRNRVRRMGKRAWSVVWTDQDYYHYEIADAHWTVSAKFALMWEDE